MNNKKAFTLVELLVVIAIIGLIASLSVIALGNARQKSRDSKRVSDVKQVQTALELFFSDQGRYPTATEWASGSLYATGTMGTTTYMERIPVSTNTFCSGGDYNYRPISNGASYLIMSCIENVVGQLVSGGIYYSPEGIKSLGTTNGLISSWQFDENFGTSTADLIGTNHGVITNGALWKNSGDCKISSCLYFDGLDDYVYLNANTLSGVKTISVWIKASPSATYKRAIIGSYIAQLNYFYPSHYNGSTYLSSNSLVSGDVWQHLSFVFYDSQMSFYIDGNFINQASFPNLNTVSRYIGVFQPGVYPSSFAFLGYMDDLRIYNRALSADEIKAIYDATK